MTTGTAGEDPPGSPRPDDGSDPQQQQQQKPAEEADGGCEQVSSSEALLPGPPTAAVVNSSGSPQRGVMTPEDEAALALLQSAPAIHGAGPDSFSQWAAVMNPRSPPSNTAGAAANTSQQGDLSQQLPQLGILGAAAQQHGFTLSPSDILGAAASASQFLASNPNFAGADPALHAQLQALLSMSTPTGPAAILGGGAAPSWLSKVPVAAGLSSGPEAGLLNDDNLAQAYSSMQNATSMDGTAPSTSSVAASDSKGGHSVTASGSQSEPLTSRSAFSNASVSSSKGMVLKPDPQVPVGKRGLLRANLKYLTKRRVALFRGGHATLAQARQQQMEAAMRSELARILASGAVSKSYLDALLTRAVGPVLTNLLPAYLAAALPRSMAALLPSQLAQTVEPQLSAIVHHHVRNALSQLLGGTSIQELLPPPAMSATHKAQQGVMKSLQGAPSPELDTRATSVSGMGPGSPSLEYRSTSPQVSAGQQQQQLATAADQQARVQAAAAAALAGAVGGLSLSRAGSAEDEATVASHCLPADLFAALASGSGGKLGANAQAQLQALSKSQAQAAAALAAAKAGASMHAASAAGASTKDPIQTSMPMGLGLGGTSGFGQHPITNSLRTGSSSLNNSSSSNVVDQSIINQAEVQQSLAQARMLAMGGSSSGAAAAGVGGQRSGGTPPPHLFPSPPGSIPGSIPPSTAPSEAPDPLELHMDQSAGLMLSGGGGGAGELNIRDLDNVSDSSSRRPSFNMSMGGTSPTNMSLMRGLSGSGNQQQVGIAAAQALLRSQQQQQQQGGFNASMLGGAGNGQSLNNSANNGGIMSPSAAASLLAAGRALPQSRGSSQTNLMAQQGGQNQAQLAGLASILQAQQAQQQQQQLQLNQAQAQLQVAQAQAQAQLQGLGGLGAAGLSPALLQSTGMPRPAAPPGNGGMPVLAQDAYMSLVQASPAVAQELLTLVQMYQGDPAQTQHLLWVVFSELRAVAMECPEVAMALLRTLQRHQGLAHPTDIDQRVMGRMLQLMRHGPSGRQLCIVGLEQWSDGLGRITKKTAYLDTILHNNQMTHKKLWAEAGEAVHQIDMRLPRQLLNDVPVPGLLMLSAELTAAAPALPDIQPRRWSDDAVWALKQLYVLACITSALPVAANADQSAAAAAASAEPTPAALELFARDIKDLLAQVATDVAAAAAAGRAGVPMPMVSAPPAVGRFASLVAGPAGTGGGPGGRGTSGLGNKSPTLAPLEDTSQYGTFTSRLFEVLRRAQLRYFRTYMGSVLPGVYGPVVEALLLSCPQDLLVPQYAEVVGAVAQLLTACSLSSTDFDPWFWDDLYRCIDHFGLHEAVRRLRSGLLPDSPIRTFTHKNKALSHIIKGMGHVM